MSSPVGQSTKDTEAKQLTALLQKAGVTNFAEFARDHDIPGGKSMLSQHLNARRPISLECAVAYANAFRVPISTISPRLADTLARAPDAQGKNTVREESTAYGKKVQHLTPAPAAHLVKLQQAIEALNKEGQLILLGRARELAVEYPRAKANPAN